MNESKVNRVETPRIQTVCLLVVAGLLIAHSMYFARAIMLPVTAAIVLHFVLSPFVYRMKRLGIPNSIGAGIVLVCLTGVVVLGVSQLQGPAVKWIQDAPKTIRLVQAKLRAVEGPVREISEASGKVEEIAEGVKRRDVVNVDVQQPSLASTVLSRTSALVATIAVSATLLYFLLASGDRFLTKCVELMPSFDDKRRVVETVRGIQHGIGRYLGTVTIINIVLGVVIGTVLWFFGVPNAALWGVMATLLNYVPFVGFLMGTAVVFFVSLLTFDTITEAALPAMAYMLINAVEANLITPAILGRSMSMNPVAILLWMMFWGWMWGFSGAILAVPLLAMLKIACDEVDSLAPVAKFISA